MRDSLVDKRYIFLLLAERWRRPCSGTLSTLELSLVVLFLFEGPTMTLDMPTQLKILSKVHGDR